LRERLPRALRRAVRPGRIGRFLRHRPVSDEFGYDRGTPIDRHYIRAFLDGHRGDIRGAVLEIKEDLYASRYGTGVTRIDILDVDPGNPAATIIADLSRADGVPGESYDCFVLTQTLQYIEDVAAAIAHARRVLVPGGVLLATLPSITRVTTELPGLTDYWRFTEASCRSLFGNAFGAAAVTVDSYGNAAAASAFLMGLAAEELGPRELDFGDPRYPVVLAVRAVRS